MATDARPPLTPQLVVGIFIMLAGVLLTLDRLQIIEIGRSLRFWPLALITVGATILTRRPDSRARFKGYALVVVGAWLQLNTLGLVRVGFWELVWPLALVTFGVMLIMQAVRRGQRSSTTGTSTGTTPNLFAVIGETKRTVSDNPFRGAGMTAFMGGCQLDLRQAVIPPGEEAVIDIFAMMGGHEVWVPSGWSVVSQVVPIMGGVEDKRLPGAEAPAVSSGTAPRLVLEGFVVMGALTIKS